MSDDKVAKLDSQPLRLTFQRVVRDVKGVLEEEELSTPIDIEVSFKSLKVTEKNRIIHSRNKEEQLTIRLATRIMPASERQG